MPGKTNRKHRRNKENCEQYKKTGQQELNKMLTLARHQKAHPNDRPAAGPINYTRKKNLTGIEKYFQKLLDKQK